MVQLKLLKVTDEQDMRNFHHWSSLLQVVFQIIFQLKLQN